MKKYLLTLAVLCLPTFAHAQDVGGITLEKGQTMLSLSATEQVDLQQDLLQGSLRMEVTGKDAKTVQDQINKAVQQALALTKGVKEVKTSTGNYNVYSYDPNPEPRPAEKIVKEKGLVQVSDSGQLLAWVNDALDNNPKSIEDYKNGRDRAIGFLVGQIMKASKGQANPQMINKMLLEEIAKR